MTRQNSSIPKMKQAQFSAILCILLVLLCYLWLGSFGLFNHLPTITAYYDKLATAFSHGSLSLEEEPDPALLALENPFDRSKWPGIDVPTDYSLYEGKYYLYFGPVPAVFLTITKFLGFGIKGDQYPAFGFICGIFVIQALILTWVRKRFFSSLPTWLLSLGILFVGLISPFPWILTRARFYEAASAGGQFFFLLGLYLLLVSQADGRSSTWTFILVGVSWALALGSKTTQILPMGVTVIMFLFVEIKSHAKHKRFFQSLYPFLVAVIPFAIGMIILGWYNWARFDSVLETGFYYELAGPDIQTYYHKLFSPIYVLPNVYNYLLNKPILVDKFPLLSSTLGIGQSIFASIQLPEIYRTGKMTGILYSTPFLIFAAALLVPFKTRMNDLTREPYNFKWMVLLFFGIFLAEFIPYVSYFWLDTRFIADFMPPLALLSLMGFWHGYETIQNNKVRRGLYLTVGISLLAISIMVGIALALDAHWEAFKEFNPVLWKAMYRNFQPQLWKQLYSILTR